MERGQDPGWTGRLLRGRPRDTPTTSGGMGGGTRDGTQGSGGCGDVRRVMGR